MMFIKNVKCDSIKFKNKNNKPFLCLWKKLLTNKSLNLTDPVKFDRIRPLKKNLSYKIPLT
jgi:hypothetical protein